MAPATSVSPPAGRELCRVAAPCGRAAFTVWSPEGLVGELTGILTDHVTETLGALDDAVRRGQIRYPGASSMFAYQFADALHTSERRGLDRFVSMQNHYNLVYREEEREMLPLCDREGIGVVPWSPLARGFLARPLSELTATPRGEQTSDSHRMEVYRSDGGDETNRRVEELAEDYGLSMAQVSPAWLLSKDSVDAPIVGMRSVEYLEEAVEALDVSPSDSDIE